MCTKDFGYISLARSYSYFCAGNTFANIPIAAEESCWAAIKRVFYHVTFFYWPSRENGEPATKAAAMIEFAIREEVICQFADGEVVLLSPAFLQADNVRPWV